MSGTEPAPWVKLTDAAAILDVPIDTLRGWLRVEQFRTATRAWQAAGRRGTWRLHRQSILDLGPEAFATPETDTAA